MRIGDEPPHGTRRRYQWRRRPCHCDECKHANTLWVRNWRARQTAE